MPSEYQKWLARNEKSAEKRELTPAEKRQNWWHYNKWYVVAAVVAVMCIISFVVSTVSARRAAPDIQIAYIGETALPEDTVAAMEKAFTAFGTDITGDGTVTVRVNQYILSEDVLVGVRMVVDLTSGDSRLYLMEDPQSFQDTYGPLGYADGVFGAENERDEPLWYLWSDCPVLTGMDIDDQEQLAALSVGRRGIDDGYEYADVDNSIWSQIIAGATKTE